MTHTDPLEGTGMPSFEERMRMESIRDYDGPEEPIMIRFTEEDEPHADSLFHERAITESCRRS